MFEEIKKIIINQLGVDDDEIKIESKFADDLGADSLDLFELVMLFEEKYGIEIPNEDLNQIVTVNDAIEYIIVKK